MPDPTPLPRPGDDPAPARASAAEHFLVCALLGGHGPTWQDAADTAMTTALEHGYAENPDRVLAAARALHTTAEHTPAEHTTAPDSTGEDHD
ncbi:hypothetical protein [uncultured Pseudonocardia sp.]|jgi:molybdopterin-biosynthesis enzyme MoeA-like protein|uniref:hypothetical protein n=1 Tax=uncultured Pseudonocardia sp. TaxID=211455 RepID=UPI002611F43C|nr:hypothetical protein [uncultured Pseudonocardia sp.]